MFVQNTEEREINDYMETWKRETDDLVAEFYGEGINNGEYEE